ncbi:MAG: bifunctional 3-deoxy-7-phosphoheptulonate synthase/chorismate mutase type II [Saprospiraceae bacterium]|nr:bifunctional 3-deoxy-7-phosphoheptulonate synthase/chorismate mutase type II [Saprospiraceae bacterium]
MNATQAQEKEKTWLTKEKRPIVIAGPCSAETEEQVIETAKRLKATNKVDIYRAGIWKPRTRPNSFEGIGVQGLPWLQKAKEETGFPLTVEVAKASHVDLCLEFGIDMLWIGARTTVNPFAVQEIADALRGVDIPIMVKNPINPDLSLWLGGIERIEKAGVREIGGIHRGFSNLSEKFFRNTPQWKIPLEFKRLRPDLPLLNDPSHICGRRDILQDVGQKAMDLNFDGLMIESHIDPDNAWSDAKQQITPEVLGAMITEMVLRVDYEDVPQLQSELETLRDEINHIDDEILNLLSNRMIVSRQIGAYKKEHNMTILQQRRWESILDKSITEARKRNMSEKFIVRLINAIHDESIDQQEEIFKENT